MNTEERQRADRIRSAFLDSVPEAIRPKQVAVALAHHDRVMGLAVELPDTPVRMRAAFSVLNKPIPLAKAAEVGRKMAEDYCSKFEHLKRQAYEAQHKATQ